MGRYRNTSTSAVHVPNVTRKIRPPAVERERDPDAVINGADMTVPNRIRASPRGANILRGVERPQAAPPTRRGLAKQEAMKPGGEFNPGFMASELIPGCLRFQGLLLKLCSRSHQARLHRPPIQIETSRRLFDGAGLREHHPRVTSHQLLSRQRARFDQHVPIFGPARTSGPAGRYSPRSTRLRTHCSSSRKFPGHA